jgi:hypothetical protein
MFCNDEMHEKYPIDTDFNEAIDSKIENAKRAEGLTRSKMIEILKVENVMYIGDYQDEENHLQIFFNGADLVAIFNDDKEKIILKSTAGNLTEFLAKPQRSPSMILRFKKNENNEVVQCLVEASRISIRLKKIIPDKK